MEEKVKSFIKDQLSLISIRDQPPMGHFSLLRVTSTIVTEKKGVVNVREMLFLNK